MNILSANREILSTGLQRVVTKTALAALLLALVPIDIAGVFSSAKAQSASRSSVNEVVVRARKRAESLQDIPDSVVVFTADMIESAGISNIEDVSALIPNFTLLNQENAGSGLITIRGIGQVRNGELPVAIVVDGVQLSSSLQVNQELFDVEQIEVLKGPQGSLYGRNAIGGAINIVTKKPDNEFGVALQAGIGNGNSQLFQGTVSGPVIEDKLFFRASVRYEDYDGLIDNTLTGAEVDFDETLSLRGRLIFQATEALSFDLRAFSMDKEAGADYYVPLFNGDVNDTKNHFISQDEQGHGDLEVQEYSFKIEHSSELGTFTSVTSFTDTDNFYIGELDYSPFPIARVSQRWDTEVFGEELRYESPSEQRLRFVVGASYLQTDRQLDTLVEFNFGGGFVPLLIVIKDDNKAYGVFGQANYDITEKLELTLGLRYDLDERQQEDPATLTVVDENFDMVQPKVSLAYKASEDLLLYATAATGFRSGGFNAPSSVFSDLYKQEESISYELGFKSQLADGRVTINGAAFYTKVDDQQYFFLRFDPIPMRPVQGITNVDKTEIFGAELELQARPIDGLDLNASFGYMDTEVKKFTETPAFKGNNLPLTYGWSYAMSAQYTIPVSDVSNLIGRIDYSARGDNYWFLDNIDKQERVDLVNARLTLEWNDFEFTAYSTNLFDEEYYSEVGVKENTGFPFDIGWPAEPRRYGFLVKARF